VFIDRRIDQIIAELRALAVDQDKFDERYRFLISFVRTSIAGPVTHDGLTVRQVLEADNSLFTVLNSLSTTYIGIPVDRMDEVIHLVDDLAHQPLPQLDQASQPGPLSHIHHDQQQQGDESSLTDSGGDDGPQQAQNHPVRREGGVSNLAGLAAAAERGGAEGGPEAGAGL